MTTRIFPTVNDVGGSGAGKVLSEASLAAWINQRGDRNFVVSGFTVPSNDPDLILPVAGGEAVIRGYRVVVDNSTDVTCYPNATNYIYLDLTKNGLNQATGATFVVSQGPLLLPDRVAIAVAITDGDNVTSTQDMRILSTSMLQLVLNNGNGPYTGTVLSRTQASSDNNTWLTIGPTGSGATVIWTELDKVPLGAKALRLNMLAWATHATGDAAATHYIRGTVRGLGWGSPAYDMIRASALNPGDDDWASNTVDVPADYRRFEFRWEKVSGSANGTLGIWLFLEGWLV